MRFLLATFALLTATFAPAERPISITILHTNDVHARVEPATLRGKSFGGYARQATVVRRLMAKEVNPILLSAGDVFQGTLYFNAYEGLADLVFMNMIGYQAMAVGNHEFDRGPGPLRAFAERATFPLLAANLDVSGEPLLKDWIRPSTQLIVSGETIGIVGAITPDLPTIASPGENVKMLDLFESVQAEVDRLRKEGVNKIVLLTHVGFELDQELARKIVGADVVVGGHSHTPLGDLGRPELARSRGEYPTVVEQEGGERVLVVQAWQWGILVGRLRVDFDAEGRVRDWSKSPPIVLDEAVEEEPLLAAVAAAFRKPIEAMANQPVGETKNGLPRGGGDGLESPMANLIADAQLAALAKQGAQLAIMNQGGVRASIEAGPITYGEAITVQPFNNTLVLLELTGDELRRALEWGVREAPQGTGGLLHVSRGVSYEVDPTKPVGERVVSLTFQGEPIRPEGVYLVALNSFLAGGGDAHEVLKNAKGRRTDTGILDIDALVEYLKASPPTEMSVEGRIRMRR